jgi:transcriptional regulator with XRE-family HTH domain
MNIGEAIREIRKAKGISQKQLAEEACISANALSSIERDEAWPTKTTISLICDALDIPVSCLLFASITEEDVPSERRAVFQALRKPIIELFL